MAASRESANHQRVELRGSCLKAEQHAGGAPGSLSRLQPVPDEPPQDRTVHGEGGSAEEWHPHKDPEPDLAEELRAKELKAGDGEAPALRNGPTPLPITPLREASGSWRVPTFKETRHRTLNPADQSKSKRKSKSKNGKRPATP